jgi:hypothetical protein
VAVTATTTLTSRLGSGQSTTLVGHCGLLSSGLSWLLHEDAWAKGGGQSNWGRRKRAVRVRVSRVKDVGSKFWESG